MSGSLEQQFPGRNTSFQNQQGIISPVWYRFFKSMFDRTGGGTATATTTDLQNQINGVDSTKVSRAGDTMTGPLVLPGVPTTSNQAATKGYVDSTGAASKVSKSGDTMTGPLVLPGAPTAPLQAADKGYVDAGDAASLPLVGGTLSGPLVLSGPPTVALNPATKAYTDAADALLLPLTGGVLTGPLTASYFKTVVTTVAGLPAAGTAGLGARAFVSDALAPTFGVTVAGAGAVASPVYSDGTNWKVG